MLSMACGLLMRRATLIFISMSQSNHSTVEEFSRHNRSRVTNARLRGGNVTAQSLFVYGDGRSPWARRYRDLVGLVCEQAGGLETLTELKLALIRRAVALTVECERMENDLADGEKIDVDLLARLSSHVRRISETIGLERVKREVTPRLHSYVKTHVAKEQAREIEQAEADA
jgi:hypothetical protein